MPGLLGLVGKGIAMGAEYREHRKERKQSRATAEHPAEPNDPSDFLGQVLRGASGSPPTHAALPYTASRSLRSRSAALPDDRKPESSSEEDFASDDESIEDDEELWELDEALTPTEAKGLPTYEQSEQEYQPVAELVRDVMHSHQPPLTSTPSRTVAVVVRSRPQLPCPVILPQRRPRKTARGFIRAYSPVLADCGISQEAFLTFLKKLHKSSQASPIFPIVKISAAIAGLAPSIIAMAVCTAAQIAADVGAEVQSQARTNNFLDCINEELFQPAGLYCRGRLPLDRTEVMMLEKRRLPMGLRGIAAFTVEMAGIEGAKSRCVLSRGS